MGRCVGGQYPPEHWAKVADDYRDEVRDGNRNVLNRLASRWSVPWTTAAGWVRKARALGLIDGTDYGVTATRKIEAVAQALGVDPSALADALVEHAGGDLRLSTSKWRNDACARPQP